MTVYVDDVRLPYGRMIMCHLWADTHDELLAMADAIGLNRRWLQRPPKASWFHFDVSLQMKARAIALGAVLTDNLGPVEHVARLEDNQEKLAQVRKLRERRMQRIADDEKAES